MNNFRSSLLIVGCLLAGWCWQTASAAGLDPKAKTRAQLYQDITREILLERKWTISTNQAGKLVANSLVPPRGARSQTLISVPMFARLTIVFTPESAKRTKCAANIVGYMDGRNIPPAILRQATGDPNVKQGVIGPLALNDDEYTKEIENIMERAETRLIKKHAELGAHD